MNSDIKGWHHRGYLPHFDSDHVHQMITYRLADSLGARAARPQQNEDDLAYRKRIETQLDKNYGSCALKDPEIAQAIIENWQHFDPDRYKLIVYVVMPNHVHLLIRPTEGQSLSKIIHGWKSYTGKLLGARAARPHSSLHAGKPPALPGWQPDYFDRYIRDENHYRAAIDYIHNNPVKAALCQAPTDWPWSSARQYAPGSAGGPPACLPFT